MQLTQEQRHALVNGLPLPGGAMPHHLLGMHPGVQGARKGVAVRTLLQAADSCEVVEVEGEQGRYQLTCTAIAQPTERGGEGGGCEGSESPEPLRLFEGFITAHREAFAYRLRGACSKIKTVQRWFCPYSFSPTLTEDDCYYINEGTHTGVFEKLGCHLQSRASAVGRGTASIPGASFAVWAPNAARVSVVGCFNNWNPVTHPMRVLGQEGRSGIWEIFVPGLKRGMHYKYAITTGGGEVLLKTDPYALAYEAPPHNASLIWNLENYTWNDNQWMAQRAAAGEAVTEKPISVYEVHLGSWKRKQLGPDNPDSAHGEPLTYKELAKELTAYVLDMGYTHVELMPISEYPFEGSWGYQVSGFYAPTHRYGTPEDFMHLVDTLHQAGIGVLLDWVPAHFPRDTFALAEFDGTHLYNHADPRQGEHQDWGTLIFNYGRPEVRGFLIGSALAWCKRYHIDGLRVDAVASMLYLDYSREEGNWVPNQYGGRENIEAIDFLRATNDAVRAKHPGVLMVAEESTSWGGVTAPTAEGGLGFHLKWNMGWMHDTLEYFKLDPIHRKHHHGEITFAMLYQYTEAFMSVFSHDEVVHGKASLLGKMGAGSIAEKARHLRSLYGFMWAWPGKKTLFMGCDFGQSTEWNHNQSLDWHLLQYTDHSGTHALVKDLNTWYTAHPSLAKLDSHSKGFQWIESADMDNSTLSFIRMGEQGTDMHLVVCNFTPVPRPNFRFGSPTPGTWQCVLNTDWEIYGGHTPTPKKNKPTTAHTQPTPWQGRNHSVDINLPGLSTQIFKLV